MKLGILEADKVRDTLVGEFGTYPDMFSTLIASSDSSVEFAIYDVTAGQFPVSIDECDAYLITGSKCSSYEDIPWIHQLRDFIVELAKVEKKLIGICFGHQLIAIALGGETKKNDSGWGVGVCDYPLFETPDWMTKTVDTFSLLAMHQDQVTCLPIGAKLLAGSDFCANAMYSIGRHILAFQGHPEFVAGYCGDLVEIRRDLIGDAKSAKAIESLKKNHHGDLIAEWILDFIAH